MSEVRKRRYAHFLPVLKAEQGYYMFVYVLFCLQVVNSFRKPVGSYAFYRFSSSVDEVRSMFLIGPVNHLCAETTHEMEANRNTAAMITTA